MNPPHEAAPVPLSSQTLARREGGTMEAAWDTRSLGLAVAVLIPCYNEEQTIAKVVADLANNLPDAKVYVCDNNSSDRSIEAATLAGAVVKRETRQGKGHVIRRLFADVDADVFVLVDGDDTYDATAAPEMVRQLVHNQLDFVNAARRSEAKHAFRRGHRMGNFVLSGLVRLFFGRQFRDMLSGYKVLSRRFVKSFPAMSRGFETETELAIHALELRMPCAELVTRYKERPQGSESKLNTVRDGVRIIRLILRLLASERPFQFFGGLGAGSMLLGIIMGVPVIVEFIETGLVPRLPTAVLSTGLVIIGVLGVFTGLILDLVTQTRQEMKRLAYLAIPCRWEP